MPLEKATGLILRFTDWSESSRIVTLWTREFGKVRALAKGGRRLKSAFESALDLLNVCDIVLVRKTSGSLDLLTEAQVVARYPRLRADLSALYGAYYVAELLADWTEENDPHAALFAEALATLDALGGSASAALSRDGVALRVMAFELELLRELGYGPSLELCAACQTPLPEDGLAFGYAAGGVLCPRCHAAQRDKQPLSPAALRMLRALSSPGEARHGPFDASARAEVRQTLGRFVTYLRGRRPRLLPYQGS